MRGRCWMCGMEFSDFEWERRHTHDQTGEDVHEDCCPRPDCAAERGERRSA